VEYPSDSRGECIRTVVYLINKLPSLVLNDKSPYEMLFGKQPKIDHLKVFGCLCFASVLPRGDKFQERARRAVMIGFCENQKGYKLYECDTGLLFVCRDVTFKEIMFPFKDRTHCEVEDMFAVTPLGAVNDLAVEENHTQENVYFPDTIMQEVVQVKNPHYLTVETTTTTSSGAMELAGADDDPPGYPTAK